VTSPFKKPSDLSGSSFFKPKEYQTALALLVEPKSIDKDVPNEYKGKTTLRDEIIADVTVFNLSESLEKGEPDEVIKSTRITHSMLTGTLSKMIGDPLIGIVRLIDTKAGSGYAFRDVEGEAQDQLIAYYTKREEAAEAAPSFDD
jgi:hypothetical protein